VNFQNAVIQAEKMVSVGGLAAGMAHEINNPLAGILQSLQVIEQRLLADTPRNIQAAGELGIDFNALRTFAQQRGISPLLAASRESCHRVTRIVANMLSFARRTDDELSPSDMTQLVEDTIDIARTDFRPEGGFDFRHIRIERVFEADLPPVPCNRSRLQQVLLNLLKNGADAMNSSGSQKEPTFTIRLSRRSGMVQLEVSDNGPGMEAEVRNRVFEPFFTTKEKGKGTGLGLSICYYIITENHKGTIDVESGPGRGTTFRIRLPLQPDAS
jgi:polar amino acid transport system substrate-binding protein